MSAEPKQTIADQLRAFARQRQDAAGAPFEPHPVTRKRLQDEVAHTFFARTIARNTSPPSWLAAFWLRLVFAGGLVGLFVFAAIFWLPKDSQPGTDLARRNGKMMADPNRGDLLTLSAPVAESGGGPGSPVPSDLLALDQTQSHVDVGQPYGLIPQAAPEASTNLKQPEADAVRRSGALGNQSAESASLLKAPVQKDATVVAATPAASPVTTPALESTALTTEPHAPPAPLPSLEKTPMPEDASARLVPRTEDKGTEDQLRKAKEVALASGSANRTAARISLTANMPATNAFFFSQSDTRAKYRRNFNSPPLPPVLRSFEVRQNGTNVRIIDADGSVYEGMVEKPELARMPFNAAGGAEVKSFARNSAGQRALTNTAEDESARQQLVPDTRSDGITFRASGTNQSLNQLIVVTGKLQSNSYQQLAGRGQVGSPETSSRAATLRGKVSVGRNVEIPIDAAGTAH